MTTIGSLFTGYGGLDLACGQFFDAHTVWTSDIDPYASKVIAERFPDAPNLGDITKIDWATVSPVDIMTGGSPCQDLSISGPRHGMYDGTRSGLWVSMREGIAVLRPRAVVWENVKGALSARAQSDVERAEGRVGGLRALGRVLGDLASLGYDAAWGVVRASDAGLPHRRERVFVVAADASDPDSLTLRPGQDSRRLDGTSQQAPLRFARSNGQPWTRFALEVDQGFSYTYVEALFGEYAPTLSLIPYLRYDMPLPLEPVSRALRPAFSEWMMGLPHGWVTDVPGVGVNQGLKIIGNGVAPRQAYLALEHLWEALV